MIIQGPSRSLYKKNIKENLFIELKERGIYQRLNRLKASGVQLPEDIDDYYNKIPLKYSFKSSTKKDSDQEDFPFWHSKAKWEGAEKRYHNWTPEQIFKEVT